MRIAGIVLIILGIFMAIFTGFNFQTKKQVAKLGPIEINKKENNHVGWPTYTGIVVALAGIGLVVAATRKN